MSQFSLFLVAGQIFGINGFSDVKMWRVPQIVVLGLVALFCNLANAAKYFPGQNGVKAVSVRVNMLAK